MFDEHGTESPQVVTRTTSRKSVLSSLIDETVDEKRKSAGVAETSFGGKAKSGITEAVTGGINETSFGIPASSDSEDEEATGFGALLDVEATLVAIHDDTASPSPTAFVGGEKLATKESPSPNASEQLSAFDGDFGAGFTNADSEDSEDEVQGFGGSRPAKVAGYLDPPLASGAPISSAMGSGTNTQWVGTPDHEGKQGIRVGGKKPPVGAGLLLMLAAMSMLVGQAASLAMHTGMSEELHECSVKVGQLLGHRYGDNFATMHARYDTDSSGKLSPAELGILFGHADIGTKATRPVWVDGFAKAFAAQPLHGVTKDDLATVFARIGYGSNGAPCVNGKGFCPTLPADILEHVNDLSERKTAHCTSCKADANHHMKWPNLHKKAAYVDNYSLFSIFRETETACDADLMADCLLNDNTCEDCSEQSKCRYDEEVLRVEGGQFLGEPIIIASDFLPMVLSMHVYAKECNVRMHVQSSLQWAEDPTAVHDSTFGSAIRLLLQDRHGICDADCMRTTEKLWMTRPPVQCFLDKVGADASIFYKYQWSKSADPTLFEGKIYACVNGNSSTALCDGKTRDKTLSPLLGIFLDYGCAHNIYLTDEIGLTDAVVSVPAYKQSDDYSEDSFPHDLETRSKLVFPTLGAVVKTWEIDPFEMEEYQSPFGEELTAPLIDGAKYIGTRVSKHLWFTDFLSRAVPSNQPGFTVEYSIEGVDYTRNRFLRLNPLLVEGLETVMEQSHHPVSVVRGYQTTSEAEASGEVPGWYQTGSAARLSFREHNSKHRLLDLASIVIRAFYPVVQPMGLGIGIGLYSDSLHVDVRPAGIGSAITTWAVGETALTAREFQQWADQELWGAPNFIHPVACETKPKFVHSPQSQAYEQDGFDGAVGLGAPEKRTSAFCTAAAAPQTKHFERVWALIDSRYSFLNMKSRRPLKDVEEALSYCLLTCDKTPINDPDIGTVPFNKIRACDLALHWLPFSFGETDGTCGFSSAQSVLKTSTCFWNNCVEETELFGLLAPNHVFRPEYVQKAPSDPKCGAEEPLFGPQNPSPLHDLIRQLYATHCSGRAVVWVENVKDLLAMEEDLKVLLAFNDAIDFVDVRVMPEAYAVVVDALEDMVNGWRPLLCRAYHREFLAPYTVSKIGGSDIKQVG